MFNELVKLYNTLMLVETKGESTKIMGQCLTYLNQLISKSNNENEANLKEKVGEEGVK